MQQISSGLFCFSDWERGLLLDFLALRLTFDVTLSRLCKGRSDDYGENEDADVVMTM